MSTAEVIQCAMCTFTTLTQKGLTIHLRKMHHIVAHDRKPRRTQNRRQSIRLANCSMSAKSWGLPFVCVICGYRTAEKLVIKEHVDRSEWNHSNELRFFSSGDNTQLGDECALKIFSRPRKGTRRTHVVLGYIAPRMKHITREFRGGR